MDVWTQTDLRDFSRYCREEQSRKRHAILFAALPPKKRAPVLTPRERAFAILLLLEIVVVVLSRVA